MWVIFFFYCTIGHVIFPEEALVWVVMSLLPSNNEENVIILLVTEILEACKTWEIPELSSVGFCRQLFLTIPILVDIAACCLFFLPSQCTAWKGVKGKRCQSFSNSSVVPSLAWQHLCLCCSTPCRSEVFLQELLFVVPPSVLVYILVQDNYQWRWHCSTLWNLTLV